MENTNRRKKMSPAKRKRRRINKAFKIAGEILVGIQILATLIFIGFTWRLGMIPIKYVAGFAGILLVFAALLFIMQVITRGKAILSKLVSILMSCILIFGSVYLYRTHNAVANLSDGEIAKQVNSMVVAVRGNDSAETVKDTGSYIYGVQHTENGSEVDQAIEMVNEEAGTEVITAEYNTLNDQAAALLDGSVQAIIYDEGYSGILDEVYEGFSNNTKIIAKYSIESESKDSDLVQGKATEVDVKDETFSMYISGIDVFGPISTSSRSDVNIIVTINPKTKQILLANTPRDYFLPIPGVSGESKDKLTHAGIYGIDKSMATLEALYRIEIPFYTRVNFTSVITIVDLIGGVDVDSAQAFTTIGGDLTVKEGMNHLNGEQALAFARERYSLADGDNDRGKNQMAIIQAIFQKMISPEMLMKVPTLIEEVNGSVETNMSMNQIQELVQSQLSSGGSWNIKSVAATGTGASEYCYSMPGTELYVMQPDQASVDEIINLMEIVKNGETLPE